ncbi:tetratricopeptide repeat protein [Tichowtungia aerotolerans]|uniref:Tetratricopeptide repeat protein n=1 Tax=Tichowtungia aerotolerans TaxID=2697043 RepID=A0A6P1MI89_9BACT|nr:tetratricopeptide repeat protein [Tichowtungia aerotolerans]QHI70765.1 tetratricopeptide repeat protein [Tichowtungia aerotolerans]
MKTFSVSLICFLLLLPASFAKKPISPSDMASSVLLKQARFLLESRKAKEAVPVLEEVLVRLQEIEGEEAQVARETALYQLGLCSLEAELYEKAAACFKTFVREYPEHANAQEARFLILEALAWQKDSSAVTSYIQQMEESGEFNEVLAVLNSKNDTTRHTVLALLSAYARTADLENWQRFLPFCDEDGRSDLDLNQALMAGGDLAVEQKDYLKALRFYHEVWMSDQLIVAYDRRLAALKVVLDTPLPWVPLSQREAQASERASENRRYEQMLAERTRLEEKNYDQDLMLRIAQCYDAMGRRWNSYVIYEHLYTAFPSNRVAERSRYAAFQCLAALEELDDAKAAAGTYLELYPAGRYRDAVTLGLVQVHLQLGEIGDAEELGLSLREQEPVHRYLDQVTYLMGYIRFEQQDYAQALELFTETSSEWPERVYAEESVYWMGMCDLFLGSFSNAVDVFEAYLSNTNWIPKAFEADVTYRLGMARYGLEEYDTSRQIFEGFLEQFPDDELCSEAWSMLGDLHGADGEMDEALKCYGEARDCAVHVKQETYAVFQAAQVYDLLNRHMDRIHLLQDYLETRGKEGEFARAVLEISRSWQALSKPANALDAYTEAIGRYGNSAELEEADRLFVNLLNESANPLRDGITAGAVVLRLAPLQKDALEDGSQKALAMRLTALLAALAEGTEQEAYDQTLLAQDSLEGLTMLPLRRFAEAAVARGKTERVQQAFELFMEKYGDSDDALPMVNVQLQLLIDGEKYTEAFELAEKSLDRYPGHPEIALTHLLAADALRLQKKYDQAVEMYKTFAAVREWRGPLTPKALYSIGLCAREQGHTQEACAWFQRVYVLYGQYPEWTAKAYAASVQCLQELGRPADAVRTMREMVANPDVVNTPEGRQATAELARMPEVKK